MAQYTELLNAKVETLSMDDDDFEENLIGVATLFRGLDEALTSFMKEHGYKGDLADASAKAQFLREKFRTANEMKRASLSQDFSFLYSCSTPTIDTEPRKAFAPIKEEGF